MNSKMILIEYTNLINNKDYPILSGKTNKIGAKIE